MISPRTSEAYSTCNITIKVQVKSLPNVKIKTRTTIQFRGLKASTATDGKSKHFLTRYYLTRFVAFVEQVHGAMHCNLPSSTWTCTSYEHISMLVEKIFFLLKVRFPLFLRSVFSSVEVLYFSPEIIIE